MPEFIKMPKLGMTMERGIITHWYKKEGDMVKDGEIIVEVMTDKANMDVESPVGGSVYKLLINEGEEVNVGTDIAIIKLKNESEDDIAKINSSSQVKKEDKEKSEEQKKEPSILRKKEMDNNGLLATPYAKYMAAKKGIDLKELYKDKKEIITEKLLPTGKKLSPIQKIMADKMVQSSKIPQFTLYYDFEVETLLLLNNRYKEKGYNSNIIPIFAKSMSLAMKKFPIFGYTFDGTELINSNHKNIGIAVQTDRGLIVPVLKNIDSTNIETLFMSYDALIQKTKNNKLTPQDMEGAGMTISNLGMFGTKQFKALVIPGQIGIIAMGVIQEGIKIVNGGIFVKKIMNVSISCDHRVIEGAIAAQFMQYLKEIIENESEENLT